MIDEPVEEILEGLYDEPEDLTTQTPLHNRYSFWYHRRGGPSKSTNYEDSIKKIESFQTVEHFWHIYDHLVRPNDIKTTTDYHLFKEGIKPMWEDAANKNGGKWMVRLKKGLASRFWEDLVLAIIGEQFDVGHEICGAVMSIRTGEDIISVWNKTTDNMEAMNKVRDQLRRILRLPSYIPVEYKKHQEAIADQTSYRNPSLTYRPQNRSNSIGSDGVGGPTNGPSPRSLGSSNKPPGGYMARATSEGYTGGLSPRNESSSLQRSSSDGSAWGTTPKASSNPGWKQHSPREGGGSAGGWNRGSTIEPRAEDPEGGYAPSGYRRHQPGVVPSPSSGAAPSTAPRGFSSTTTRDTEQPAERPAAPGPTGFGTRPKPSADSVDRWSRAPTIPKDPTNK